MASYSDFLILFFFFFWLHPWYEEVPGPGIEPMTQQRPKPLSDNMGSLTC